MGSVERHNMSVVQPQRPTCGGSHELMLKELPLTEDSLEMIRLFACISPQALFMGSVERHNMSVEQPQKQPVKALTSLCLKSYIALTEKLFKQQRVRGQEFHSGTIGLRG